jgi:hypothetical protein
MLDVAALKDLHLAMLILATPEVLHLASIKEHQGLVVSHLAAKAIVMSYGCRTGPLQLLA